MAGLGVVLFSAATPRIARAELPPPVEYVLAGHDAIIPRDQYGATQAQQHGKPFTERVQTRGAGARSDRWVTGVTLPSLTVFLPAGEPSAAVVICPGGGYAGLSFDKEGVFVAEWMRTRGVAAGVLKYHTAGDDGALLNKPYEDASLAIRYMKSHHGGNVGVMGFSAGGHLAATAATRPADGHGGGVSRVALQDTRLAFAVLIYPVVSMHQGVTHGGSRTNLLGGSPSDATVQQWSADQQVGDQTPPTFLVHATDDRAVPAENAVRYYRACLEHNVPAELHLFEKGGHGFGMWREELPVGQWPTLLEAWMRQRGLMSGPNATPLSER